VREVIMKRTAIEMFNLELDGKFGKFRQKNAVENIAFMEKQYEDREMTVEDGVAVWKCGSIVPMGCVAAFLHSKYGNLINIENHESALDAEAEEVARRYRERMQNHVYSEEELFEMRSAFGEGVEVVDVISGNKIRL
jgi:hypothetical protein